MSTPKDKEIAARAYRLWDLAGMPQGRDEEFWRAAELELGAEVEPDPRRMPDAEGR